MNTYTKWYIDFLYIDYLYNIQLNIRCQLERKNLQKFLKIVFILIEGDKALIDFLKLADQCQKYEDEVLLKDIPES